MVYTSPYSDQVTLDENRAVDYLLKSRVDEQIDQEGRAVLKEQLQEQADVKKEQIDKEVERRKKQAEDWGEREKLIIQDQVDTDKLRVDLVDTTVSFY